MSLLTPPQPTLIIPTLVQQVPAWVNSHEKKEMPIIARLINRLRFQMQEILWWALFGELRLAWLSFHVCYPDNVHRQKSNSLKRCPQSFKKEVNHNVTA